MDLKQVEQVLEKYWEGNSSLEEEKMLQEFFTSNDLPKHLEMYSALFISPELSINPKLGKEFDNVVLEKIKSKPKANVWILFKIAAVGLILLITSISVFQVDTKKQMAKRLKKRSRVAKKEERKDNPEAGFTASKNQTTETDASTGNEFHLKVYSPYKLYFEGMVESVTAVNLTGTFDILKGHKNFLTLLIPSELLIRSTERGEEKLKINRGVMHVKADQVVIFLDV